MATSNWGITPRQSIERICRDRGDSVVIDGCIELLGGATDVDSTLIYALGGPPAQWAVTGGDGGPDYWLRVWAARGLLWVWDDRATPVVETALTDPACLACSRDGRQSRGKASTRGPAPASGTAPRQ